MPAANVDVAEALDVMTPVLLTLKSDVVATAVELEISKSRVLVSPLLADIANFAHGVVVPMPTLPASVTFTRDWLSA